MKKLLIGLLAIGSLSAFAVPRGVYSASPKKIEVTEKKLNLFFDLPCKNRFPDEWAGNLIALSNDEGDMSIALGVVLAETSCDKGPVREFVFSYDLKREGLSAQESYEPIVLSK